MSDDREYWEARFVDAFVLKHKRPRYKTCLPNPRDRFRILDRLNHSADFDFSRGLKLKGNDASSQRLIERLLDLEIEDKCWLVSDDSELDCKHLPIREAAELTVSADWGTLMICPPKPIVVYRTEASDKGLYLFT